MLQKRELMGDRTCLELAVQENGQIRIETSTDTGTEKERIIEAEDLYNHLEHLIEQPEEPKMTTAQLIIGETKWMLENGPRIIMTGLFGLMCLLGSIGLCECLWRRVLRHGDPDRIMAALIVMAAVYAAYMIIRRRS